MTAATGDPVRLGAEPLQWAAYERVVYGRAPLVLADTEQIARSRRELERRMADGAVIYAVNTGYGAEASRVVAPDAIGRVQLNTLRSHAIRVGEPVAPEIVRGMLLLKAQAFAQGPPAVRVELVERLVRLVNEGPTPKVYSQGSQSASGDLIPNAQLGLALAEEPGRPFQLEMKEAVSLTNDVSFATALAFDAIRSAERLVERGERVAAMSLQALLGHPEAYDERLIRARPHAGALISARHMRELLEGSSLLRDPGRPHDPYSLRCVPQVHGALRDAIAYARAAVEVEIASVGDNPLVFTDPGEVISGGNFHGAPIGIPMDTLATALATVAAFAQRRVHHLVNPIFDVGLPPKLTRDPSERFGLVMANNAAASLASEAAVLARPASTASIGVDAMEDHVAMAALAAQQAQRVAVIARRVFAIELLCAAQALDFQGPDRASPPVRALHRDVRRRVAFTDDDRSVSIADLEDLL